MGKVYKKSDGHVFVSEVTSMGLERLADPETAAELAMGDPEHLALILTLLKLRPEAKQ